MENKGNIEDILIALNEAIEDKDIVLINSIILILGNKYSKNLDSIVLLDDDKVQNRKTIKFNVTIPLTEVIKKPKPNYIVEGNNQSNQHKNFNNQINSGNNFINNKPNQNQQPFSNYNNNLNYNNFNNDKSNNQNVFLNDLYNGNKMNYYKDNTNFNPTNIIKENNFNKQIQQNSVNQINNQIKNKTDLYQNKDMMEKSTNLHLKNQMEGPKINHQTNIYNQNNKLINDIRKTNNCTEDLNYIVKNYDELIKDYESFCNVMGCNNRNDQILMPCNEYHEFKCSKCLENYYKKKYPELKEILFDKFICPICKYKSPVDSSHEVLQYVFGVKKFNELL